MKKFILPSVLLSATVLLSGCTVFDDWGKDFESDTKGLERIVTVYSKDGKVLKKYHGKNVRTKYNENGGTQVTINIDGKRVQVINADVIVEEKGSEQFEVK